MSSKNFFKVWHELFEKPIWLNSTPEQKTILMALLHMAKWQSQTWEWKGRPYHCEPGEVITSANKIALNCGKGISRMNIRTALKRFECLGFLTYETSKNWEDGIKVRISNWRKYQKSNQPLNQPINQPTTQPKSNNNNDFQNYQKKSNQPLNQPINHCLTTNIDNIDNTNNIYNISSSSSIDEKLIELSEEEEELLKSFSKRKKGRKIGNYTLWREKVIKNPNLKKILLEEKEKIKTEKERKQQAEKIPPENEEKSSPEDEKRGLELLRNTVKKIKKGA